MTGHLLHYFRCELMGLLGLLVAGCWLLVAGYWLLVAGLLFQLRFLLVLEMLFVLVFVL